MPTSPWDIVVVKQKTIVAAVSMEAETGASIGMNHLTRVERLLGKATDLRAAYADGVFRQAAHPWLGYIFLLEESPAARNRVPAQQYHLPVAREFDNVSYAAYYERICHRLLGHCYYNGVAFLMTDKTTGMKGRFIEPSCALRFEAFARSLAGQVRGLS